MSRWKTILAIALVALTALAGTGAFRLWREQSRVAIAREALPVIPNLIRWPAAMVAAVQDNHAAVKGSRDPLKPLGRLASLYLANGFEREARQILEALRRLDPENPRWPYLLADLELRAGEALRAQTLLELVVQLDPDCAPAWLRLGNLLIEQRSIDRAEACFREAALVAPGDARVAFTLISFEARHGQRVDPRRHLVELIQNNPGIRELHALLAELHAAAGDPAAAKQERRRAAHATRWLSTEDPWLDDLHDACHDPNRLGLAAERLGREGRLPQAERLLRRAIELAPADPTPRKALGTLLQTYERLGDARTVLATAITDLPDEPALRIALARSLCLEHKPLDAVPVVRAALQRWPENADLHAALGFAWSDARENEEAIAALEEALHLDPGLVEARYRLAFCLLALRQREAARAAVEHALSLRPAYPEALVLLGGLELQQGEVENAERHILALFELQPDEPGSRLLFAALHLEKGNAALAAGKLDEASRLYHAGLEASPEFAPLLRQAATVEARRGEYGDVVELFERYLRIEPRDLEAYAPLSQAYREIGRPGAAERVLERGSEMAAKLGNAAKQAEFEALLDQLF